MIRIWEGDYVRISSYQREISSWLDIKFSNQSKIDKKTNQLFFEEEVQYNDFVKAAESIVISKSSAEKKSRDIIALDALRYLKNKSGDETFYFYIKDLLKL